MILLFTSWEKKQHKISVTWCEWNKIPHLHWQTFLGTVWRGSGPRGGWCPQHASLATTWDRLGLRLPGCVVSWTAAQPPGKEWLCLLWGYSRKAPSYTPLKESNTSFLLGPFGISNDIEKAAPMLMLLAVDTVHLSLMLYGTEKYWNRYHTQKTAPLFWLTYAEK